MTNQLPVVKVGNLNFDTMNTTVGLVTPEIAAQLLRRNFENNRNVASTVVRRYSALMKENRWELSDPIKFAEDGTLIDGQHRLNAVIHSGESVPFVILTGYPKGAIEVLDQGKKRDATNIMQFRGMPTNPLKISIMRTVVSVSTGKDFVLSPSQVVDLIEVYEDGLSFACQYSGNPNSIKYAPVISTVFMAYYFENHGRLDDFLYCWHTGTVRCGVEDNAAILLRNNYLQSSDKKGGEFRRQFFYKSQSALSYFLKSDCPKYFKEVKKVLWGAEKFEVKSLSQEIKSLKSK